MRSVAVFRAGGFGQEMLAERFALTLVVGPDVPAIELGRFGQHALERELAHPLAVLDHERDVMGPHLERGGRPPQPPGRVITEAGVEEAGVMGAKLAGGRVVVGYILIMCVR